MNEEIRKLVLETAAKSPCEKRKVGAVIVDSKTNKVLATGYNYNYTGYPNETCRCEDTNGVTLPTVIHAEVSAIENLHKGNGVWNYSDLTMFISHSPCNNCLKSISKAGIEKIEVIESFMKFDTDKLRYDLIPISWERGDAEVLTKGAKKYKPNNWKNIEKAEILRYYAAARRHLADWKAYMDGDPNADLFDNGEMGIGTHHLLNARTNIGFLYTLTETEEKARAVRDVLLRHKSDKI